MVYLFRIWKYRNIIQKSKSKLNKLLVYLFTAKCYNVIIATITVQFTVQDCYCTTL